MRTSCSNPLPVPCYGKYYVFSSTPALSHADRPRKLKPAQVKSGTCFPNHATNIRTRGAHEFYNMMWDPSVYRGNTTKPYSTPEIERCNKKRKELENVKRRKFPRKQKLIGGIDRHSLHQAEKADKIGLGDMGMQTEQFLSEMTSDVAKKDMCTQMDVDPNARRDEGGFILKPFIIGYTQTTQTDPSLSFPFEENVRPIQQTLSRKIMEQSLLETTEEMELESFRKEKRKYVELRSEELFRLKREVDARRIVTEERMNALNRGRQEAELEKEAEARLGAGLFAAGCVGGMLPITFGFLKLEGFMPESGAKEIYENLLPWMDEEIRKSYGGRNIVSRKLLDEMLYNITTEREAQIASNQFYSSSSNANSKQLYLSSTDDDSSAMMSLQKYKGFRMPYGEEHGEE